MPRQLTLRATGPKMNGRVKRNTIQIIPGVGFVITAKDDRGRWQTLQVNTFSTGGPMFVLTSEKRSTTWCELQDAEIVDDTASLVGGVAV